jgi:hypothetical protein
MSNPLTAHVIGLVSTLQEFSARSEHFKEAAATLPTPQVGQAHEWAEQYRAALDEYFTDTIATLGAHHDAIMALSNNGELRSAVHRVTQAVSHFRDAAYDLTTDIEYATDQNDGLALVLKFGGVLLQLASLASQLPKVAKAIARYLEENQTG